jgi:hypothetical protein
MRATCFVNHDSAGSLSLISQSTIVFITYAGGAGLLLNVFFRPGFVGVEAPTQDGAYKTAAPICRSRCKKQPWRPAAANLLQPVAPRSNLMTVYGV